MSNKECKAAYERDLMNLKHKLDVKRIEVYLHKQAIESDMSHIQTQLARSWVATDVESTIAHRAYLKSECQRLEELLEVTVQSGEVMVLDLENGIRILKSRIERLSEMPVDGGVSM